LEVTEQELKDKIETCKNQDNKIYQLFKTFGSMTKWDAYDLYNYFHGHILDSSVGRSIATLSNQGIIAKTGILVQSDMGSSNNLYKIMDESIDVVGAYFNQRTPKSISVKVITKTNADGTQELDYEAMVEELGNKMDLLSKNLNK
jgi:hypothetical protein